MVAHDLAGDAGDERRFATAALLVGWAKPIPAFRLVRFGPLRGVSHEAGLFFRDEVHARAGGKILRRLRVAVEHDHQRNGLSMIAARGEEPIGAASGGIFVGAFDEAIPRAQPAECPPPPGRVAVRTGARWRAKPIVPLRAVEGLIRISIAGLPASTCPERNLRQKQLSREATEPEFQDQLIAKLGERA